MKNVDAIQMISQKKAFSTSLQCLKGPKYYVNRKTGRGSGYGVIPRFESRYLKSMGRNFQRFMGINFGVDTGLEDRLLLMSIGTRQRRLDDKKMRQLGQILEEKIGDVISMDENLAQMALQMSRVSVDRWFSQVSVYWICRGEGDDVISETLENSKHLMRKKVGEILGITCPEIRFIGDKTKLMEAEMEKLFRNADYGMDYRLLSKSARVLGNVDEKDQKVQETIEKIPKWLQAIRDRKREKEEI